MDGDNTTLHCKVVRGNPMNYKYHWTHMSTTNDNSVLLASTQNLTLSDIIENETGTYFCTVENEAGNGTGNLSISYGGNIVDDIELNIAL